MTQSYRVEYYYSVQLVYLLVCIVLRSYLVCTLSHLHLIVHFILFLHWQYLPHFFFCFFFKDTAPPEISTLSLHDALPIWARDRSAPEWSPPARCSAAGRWRAPGTPRPPALLPPAPRPPPAAVTGSARSPPRSRGAGKIGRAHV